MKFFYALTLLFIGLKLTDHIAWSYWAVLLPLYGGPIILGLRWIAAILYVAKYGSALEKLAVKIKYGIDLY